MQITRKQSAGEMVANATDQPGAKVETETGLFQHQPRIMGEFVFMTNPQDQTSILNMYRGIPRIS